MNKKWFMIALIILTIFNLSVMGTFIYRRWCFNKANCNMDENEHFYRMKKRLGLTDEQVSKVKDFRKKFHPKINGLSQTLKEKRLDLVKELMAQSPDSTRINYLLKQMDSSQSALQQEVVNHLLLEKDIFTKDQQEKFFSFVLERFSVGNKRR